jgi:hypothetical protein
MVFKKKILSMSCPNVFIGHPLALNPMDTRLKHAGMTVLIPELYLNVYSRD